MISMIAVVLTHAYNYTDTFLQPHTIITEGLHPGACVQYAISNAITRFAVPLFFMISVFLFFFGKNFGPTTYVAQLFIIMSIVSPVVYFLVKKLNFICLFILACLWMADKHLVVGGYTLFNSDAYMFFTLGAYFAVNEIKYKKLFQKTENKKMWGFSVVLWVLVVTVYTLFSATAKNSSWIQLILFKFSVLFGIVSVWLSYDRVNTRLLENNVTKTLTKNNFMVYLLHEPLLHIIFMSTVTYFKSDIVHSLLYFVLPIVIILLCAYIGKLLRSKYPKLNSVLTGGR